MKKLKHLSYAIISGDFITLVVSAFFWIYLYVSSLHNAHANTLKYTIHILNIWGIGTFLYILIAFGLYVLGSSFINFHAHTKELHHLCKIIHTYNRLFFIIPLGLVLILAYLVSIICGIVITVLAVLEYIRYFANVPDHDNQH